MSGITRRRFSASMLLSASAIVAPSIARSESVNQQAAGSGTPAGSADLHAVAAGV